MRRILLATVGVTLLLLPGLGVASADRATDGGGQGDPEIGFVLPALVTVAYGPSANFAMSSDAHVQAGEVHHGELVALFGDVVIDGTVTGEVVVIMGSLRVNGTIESDVISVLSETTLTENARIEGELVNIGWSIDRAHGSVVEDGIINVSFMNLIPFSGEGGGWSAILWVIFIIKLALLTILFMGILLVSTLAPRRVSVIAAAIPMRWGWSILAGLLTMALFVITSCILAFSLIGLPLAIVLWLAMQVTKWLGIASIFYLVGQTIGRNVFHRELPHLSCVLGGFLIYCLVSFIPFFGWILTPILHIVAVGMVILTKFGAEEPWGHSRIVEPRSAPPAGGGTPPPQPTPPAES
ncbi:MAG: hypothetical protein O7A63_11685 [Acidobacteria bacterium]|nr:hypothetical protein [Acidobacteriota bacterium]